jgi:hypothetical protein
MNSLDHLPAHVRGLWHVLARHAVHGIALHETHISWVLLDDTHAYKLRKRIKLPFVDFSSLAARRDDCMKEVALNSRWAPDLYLGVVDITGSDEQPELEGRGPVIDCAVRMRRLPAQSLLKDRIIAGSRLSPSDMGLLAQAIVQAHHAAPVITGNARVPSHWDIGPALQALLDQLLDHAANDAQRQWLSHIDTWVHGQLARGKAWMQSRARGGFIRDCHGDLHTGNVAWWNGRWTLFDGIEFDAKLRTIDVMADLAFMTMDLKVLGRADLAFALLDAYLLQTGDHDGLKMLRLHEVHRALVRMLVARLAGDPSHDAYMAFIDAAMADSVANQSRLVLMHGLSGSGKSVVSQALTVALSAVRACSDVERKRLYGLHAQARSDATQDIYTDEANERTLARLLQCAQASLEGGWPFIADATFLTQAARGRFWSMAERLACAVTIVHCEADLQTLRNRIRIRQSAGLDPSEATEDVLLIQVARAEPLTRQELACAVTACTEKALSAHDITALCEGILADAPP